MGCVCGDGKRDGDGMGVYGFVSDLCCVIFVGVVDGRGKEREKVGGN